MKNILSKNWKEIMVVLFLAISVTFLTSSRLVFQYLRLPPGNIFIGLPHYTEDYFYYLDQFYQAAHGKWLVDNYFTSEEYQPALIYPGHVLIGKIGGLLGLETFTAYNLSVLILKFIFILVSYVLICKIFPGSKKWRLITLVLFLFSTSFPEIFSKDNGPLLIKALPLFRAENTIVSRFGNVPSIILRNTIFIICFLQLNKLLVNIRELFDAYGDNIRRFPSGKILKAGLFIMSTSLFLTFLTASDAAKTLLLYIALGIQLLTTRPKKITSIYLSVWIIILVLLILPSFWIVLSLFRTLDLNPIYKSAVLWDINEHKKQIEYLIRRPEYIFISFGPLSIALIASLFQFVKEKLTPIRKFGYIILCLSLGLYAFPLYRFVPIPGFRFIFPAIYIFAASAAIYGLAYIGKKLHLSLLHILIIYLIPCFITFSISLRENTIPLSEYSQRLAYLPKDLYDGYIALRGFLPADAVVIANPHTDMDLLIPGLSGKKTYSGHILMTENSSQKNKLADEFLYKWTDQNQAMNFLKDNKIRYVVLTRYDADPAQLKRDYKFLEVVFENPMITIFEFKNSII